jgi:hypothetical protein
MIAPMYALFPGLTLRNVGTEGAANVASGLSSGFTIGSSTSRAAAMDQAGSRTQLLLLVMAAGALLLLLFGADLLADIPSLPRHRGDRRGVGDQAHRCPRVEPSVAAVVFRNCHRSNLFRRDSADRTAGWARAGVHPVADQPAAQGRSAGRGCTAGFR